MAKKYEELVISDDFMYGKVSQDLSITKGILEMAIDKPIEGISFADNQKTLKGIIEGKEVRLDTYVEDFEKNTFDPFDKGLCKYTFENICQEMPELKLGDGCVKIFFNSNGKHFDNLTDNQKAFIEYLKCGRASDDLTRKIDAKVKDIRKNTKWRREYMKALLHDQDIVDEVSARFEKIVADKDAELADKDVELADKDAEIARLKKLLQESNGK